jgi:hypothetical protein
VIGATPRPSTGETNRAPCTRTSSPHDRGDNAGERIYGGRHDLRSAHPVIDRILADTVVVVHLAFIAFVAIGGLIAWRRPKVLWLHVPAVVWAAGIVTIGYPCPLTSLEDDLRSRAGERVYPGGFIAHYLDNVLYPERFKALARLLVALLVVIGWVGVVAIRWGRRWRGVPSPRTKPVSPPMAAGGRS